MMAQLMLKTQQMLSLAVWVDAKFEGQIDFAGAGGEDAG
jgi:hypothetical protein